MMVTADSPTAEQKFSDEVAEQHLPAMLRRSNTYGSGTVIRRLGRVRHPTSPGEL